MVRGLDWSGGTDELLVIVVLLSISHFAGLFLGRLVVRDSHWSFMVDLAFTLVTSFSIMCGYVGFLVERKLRTGLPRTALSGSQPSETIKVGHLNSLLGEQLSSVTFVQNYLQLDFDGKRLTVNQMPIVNTTAGTHIFGNSGYRDDLCSIIGRLVSAVQETQPAISIIFDEGSSIRVDLANSAFPEGDRLIFHDTLTNGWSWW